MFTTLITTAMLLAQAPAQGQPPGKGYEQAAGNYSRMENTGSELSQLQRRLQVAEERVAELTAELDANQKELVAIDRREMEDLVYIKDRYKGDHRDTELEKTQRAYAKKRKRTIDDQASLEADLERASKDVLRLSTDLDRAKADLARRNRSLLKPNGASAVESATQRIRSYFEKKADEIDAPTVTPVPHSWVEVGADVRG